MMCSHKYTLLQLKGLQTKTVGKCPKEVRTSNNHTDTVNNCQQQQSRAGTVKDEGLFLYNSNNVCMTIKLLYSSEKQQISLEAKMSHFLICC